MVLWLDWFGFNAESYGSLATPQDVIVMRVTPININLAAACGMLASVIISHRVFGRIGQNFGELGVESYPEFLSAPDDSDEH